MCPVCSSGDACSHASGLWLLVVIMGWQGVTVKLSQMCWGESAVTIATSIFLKNNFFRRRVGIQKGKGKKEK